MEFIILAFIIIGFIALAIYLKKPLSGPEAQLKEKEAKILVLEKGLSERDTTIANLTKQLGIAAARTEDFEQIKLHPISNFRLVQENFQSAMREL